MADVLITGAAGGIGQETVKAFAARGFRVISLDRRPLPEEIAASLDPAPLSIVVDLTDDSSVEAAAAEVAASSIDLRHFVGIAGGAFDEESRMEKEGSLPDVNLFRRGLELNLVSQWNILYRVLPHLEAAATAENVDCSVTFVSSINALASYGLLSYSAAKAGLHGLMGALCGKLGPKGIRVNAFAPGTIPTPRTEAEWAHDPGHFESLGKTAALGRCGTAAQMGASLCALALDLTHTTGQVIVADGGQMMKRGW